MNDAEREVLRILNNPKLLSGEKARLVAELTGTRPAPHGPGMADIRRTSRGGSYAENRRNTGNWQGF